MINKKIGFSVLFCFFLFGCVFHDCELKECQNGGVLLTDECRCNCPTGFEGGDCSRIINLKMLHADVSLDGAPSYSYDSKIFDLKIYASSLNDSIWIDGYDTIANSYCFLLLNINDFKTIKAGDIFPINSSYNLGTCWASFLDPAQDPNPYYPKINSSGKLTITTWIPGTKIAGSFDFSGYNGASVAQIDGWFEGQ